MPYADLPAVVLSLLWPLPSNAVLSASGHRSVRVPQQPRCQAQILKEGPAILPDILTIREAELIGMLDIVMLKLSVCHLQHLTAQQSRAGIMTANPSRPQTTHRRRIKSFSTSSDSLCNVLIQLLQMTSTLYKYFPSQIFVDRESRLGQHPDRSASPTCSSSRH